MQSRQHCVWTCTGLQCLNTVFRKPHSHMQFVLFEKTTQSVHCPHSTMALGKPAGFSLEGSLSVQRRYCSHVASHTHCWSVPHQQSPCISHMHRHCWSVQRKQSPSFSHAQKHCGQSQESSHLASQMHRNTAGQSKKAVPLHITHTAGQSWESSSLASCSPRYWWLVPLHLSHTQTLLVSPLASPTHTAGQSWQKAVPLALRTRTAGQSQQKAVPLHHTHTLLVSPNKKQSPCISHKHCWSV